MTICINCVGIATSKYNQLAPMCEIHYKSIVEIVKIICNKYEQKRNKQVHESPWKVISKKVTKTKVVL